MACFHRRLDAGSLIIITEEIYKKRDRIASHLVDTGREGPTVLTPPVSVSRFTGWNGTPFCVSLPPSRTTHERIPPLPDCHHHMSKWAVRFGAGALHYTVTPPSAADKRAVPSTPSAPRPAAGTPKKPSTGTGTNLFESFIHCLFPIFG